MCGALTVYHPSRPMSKGREGGVISVRTIINQVNPGTGLAVLLPCKDLLLICKEHSVELPLLWYDRGMTRTIPF